MKLEVYTCGSLSRQTTLEGCHVRMHYITCLGIILYMVVMSDVLFVQMSLT
jgi:hypothetical protein